MKKSTISIIIPTYNEEKNVVNLIRFLTAYGRQRVVEIIVVDGGSFDNTVELAFIEGVKVLVNPIKSRASQMNYGASVAEGDILYFVHADVMPPTNYADEIIRSVEKGYDAGNFTSTFKSSSFMLRINSLMSSNKCFFFRGGGDLTLFITKKAFDKLNGFNEYYIIMEDFDMVKRIRSEMRFNSLQSKAQVSARKYEYNAYWKVSISYILTYTFYRFGASPNFLLQFYRCLIKNGDNHPCVPAKRKLVVPVGDFCHVVKNENV